MDLLLSTRSVLVYDETVAAYYGEIRADLENKVTPIGVNDLHIAGHARSRGLVLVTNYEKEFVLAEATRQGRGWPTCRISG